MSNRQRTSFFAAIASQTQKFLLGHRKFNNTSSFISYFIEVLLIKFLKFLSLITEKGHV